MGALRTDIRLAVRRLAAAPGFFATAVITLALGMGANALLFSAVNGLLLRPMPLVDVDAMVWLFAESTETPGARETVTGDEGEALARSTKAFEATAAIGDSALVRILDREHQRWRGIWATAGLFEVLGVAPALGAVPRELPPDDAPRAMMLGYSRWQRDFGGDTSIVGRELQFADNKRFVVAGVLPDGLAFPFARAPHKGNGAGFRPGEQDYWILAPDRQGSHPGGVMIAKVAPGRDRASLDAELAARPIPRTDGGSPAGPRRTLVTVGARDQILGPLARALPLLQAFALLVLAIACANLASLMTAREAARQNDVVVRLALGASTSDLVRLRAADAFVISAVGAAVGLAFAWAGRSGLMLMAPEHIALLDRIHLDGRVLAALGAAATLTTVAFGVLPALRSRSTRSLSERFASRSTRHDVQRPLRALVVVQVALSMTLAASAVTMGYSLNRLLQVDAGYETEGVIAADTILYIPNAEASAIQRRLRERLLAQPGVEAVGFVHSTPLTGQWIIRDSFEVQEGPAKGETPPIEGGLVSYDYFEAMRIPIVAGRSFVESDLGRRDYPVIINDIAARRFFPGRNPVGERVRMSGRLREIVGVVGATRDLALDAPAEAQWYQPGLFGTSQMVVRGPGLPNLTDVVRHEITRADPRFIIQGIRRLDDIVAGTVTERRVASRLVGVFAALAVLLAGVGLYGVMSFGVAQRRREFGIRAAIGANPGRLLSLLLRQGVSTTSVGILVGSVLSGFAFRLIQPLPFEVPAFRMAPLVLAALLLLVVAVVATLGPALRAARTNPTVALTDL